MQFLSRSTLMIYGALKLLLIALFSVSLNYASNVSAGQQTAYTGIQFHAE